MVQAAPEYLAVYWYNNGQGNCMSVVDINRYFWHDNIVTNDSVFIQRMNKGIGNRC